MTRITSAIAAALVASASFATAALAENNYYDGVTPSSAGQQVSSQHRADAGVSYGYTGSITRASSSVDANGAALNRGDYYQGVNRPN